RAAQPVVGAVHRDECGAQLLQVGRTAVLDRPFREDDADRLAFSATDGVLPRVVATEAELGLVVHLDLGDHPTRRRVAAAEVDAGRLADDAATTVATDDVPRPDV